MGQGAGRRSVSAEGQRGWGRTGSRGWWGMKGGVSWKGDVCWGARR